MDTLFQSPFAINTQRKDANVTNKRRIASDIHTEMMKDFKGFTIQSTISDSSHSDSDELVDAISNSKELVDALSNSKELDDAVSDLASDLKVATNTSDGNVFTDTTNGNSPHKLLANREVPAIIQGVIPPVTK